MDIASVPNPRKWYMVVPHSTWYKWYMVDDTQSRNEKQVGQEIVNCSGYSDILSLRHPHRVVWKSVQEGDLGCSCIFKDR